MFDGGNVSRYLPYFAAFAGGTALGFVVGVAVTACTCVLLYGGLGLVRRTTRGFRQVLPRLLRALTDGLANEGR